MFDCEMGHRIDFQGPTFEGLGLFGSSICLTIRWVTGFTFSDLPLKGLDYLVPLYA